METLTNSRTDIAQLLPRSKELIAIDPSARAFYEYLVKQGDPYDVIDRMLCHYAGVIAKQQEQLVKYIERYGPIE